MKRAEEPEHPGSKINWDIRFVADIIKIALSDACVKSLNAGIHGLRSQIKLDGFLNHNLDFGLNPVSGTAEQIAQCKENNKRLHKQLCIYLKEVLIELEEMVYDHIGRPTCILWATEIIDGKWVATPLGDFRILEWQREHIDVDGNYSKEVLEEIQDDDGETDLTGVANIDVLMQRDYHADMVNHNAAANELALDVRIKESGYVPRPED